MDITKVKISEYNKKSVIDLHVNGKQSSFFLKLFSFLLALLLLFVSLNVGVINNEEHLKNALANTVWENSEPSLRGIFYDRRGNPLVSNVDKYDLYIKSQVAREDYDILLNLLNENGYISKDINFESSSDQSILNSLDSNDYLKILKLIEEKDLDNVIFFKQGYKRKYLYPEEFSHIIGYTGPVEENDLGKGYISTDHIGKYKLEYSLEDELKGVKGKRSFIDGIPVVEGGKKGNDVYLTIDLDWQKTLYSSIKKWSEELGAAGGAGVVMNASTGEVLSLVSTPGFDGNLFIRGLSEDDLANLTSSRQKPLVDKALTYSAPPGSIFKLITSYELLKTSTIDINSYYYSNGCISIGNIEFCEFNKNVYGSMNVIRALYKSSNLFFCENLVSYSNTYDLNTFSETARKFGLGEKSGINIPGEVNGNVDSPTYKSDTLGIGWYPGDTCNMAIGQGAMLTTAMQMVLVPAVYNNGGNLLIPNIISKITDGEDTIVERAEVKVKRIIDVASVKDTILTGMSEVAYNPEGTVYYFLHDLPGNLRVKTGSSETMETTNTSSISQVNGWVIGLFEFEGETYSFAFFMPYSGGSFYMTQVVRDFILEIYK
jgi:penicillin-binding protein 2